MAVVRTYICDKHTEGFFKHSNFVGATEAARSHITLQKRNEEVGIFTVFVKCLLLCMSNILLCTDLYT